MTEIRLNEQEQEILTYLKANPESVIVKFQTNYWYTYIHNSPARVTVKMVDRFHKYGLIDMVKDGYKRNHYQLSEKGKSYGN